MRGLINRLLGRRPNTLPPFDFARNRYPAKKAWPPNLRVLTEKQQFRFERKFKRRLKLKSIRPQWDNTIKIVQWSMISFVVIYGVLFHDFRDDPMNPQPGSQVFEGFRVWFWGLFGGFYTHTEEAFRIERGIQKPGQTHGAGHRIPRAGGAEVTAAAAADAEVLASGEGGEGPTRT